LEDKKRRCGMKKFGIVLSSMGVLVVFSAFVWHLIIGFSAGNPATPVNSSPSNIAIFGNSLILVGILLFLKKK
jgi:hypothetical protein